MISVSACGVDAIQKVGLRESVSAFAQGYGAMIAATMTLLDIEFRIMN
jgi:hypothetical protein